MMMCTIGSRDDLTPSMCEKAAAAWRTITAENPKAKFMLHIGGFDDDPRELWEFPEVPPTPSRWANSSASTPPRKQTSGSGRAKGVLHARLRMTNCRAMDFPFSLASGFLGPRLKRTLSPI